MDLQSISVSEVGYSCVAEVSRTNLSVKRAASPKVIPLQLLPFKDPSEREQSCKALQFFRREVVAGSVGLRVKVITIGTPDLCFSCKVKTPFPAP